MTQIRGFIGATRRPGELGVHSLDGFNLVVPDMKLAETFYGEFGLDLEGRGNRIDVHTSGHGHRWGTIIEGPRKRLSHLSFGVFEDDFPRFKERLSRLGVTLLDPIYVTKSEALLISIYVKNSQGTRTRRKRFRRGGAIYSR